MATVEVTFTPLPAHVRTARLVATAVARRSGVDESLLDEVRLAVGEACSRAVEAHQMHCPQQPITVALSDDGERFEVVVTDAAPTDAVSTDAVSSDSQGATDHERDAGVPPAEVTPSAGDLAVDGLAVIAGLADDVRVIPAEEGTSIAMSWKRRVAQA